MGAERDWVRIVESSECDECGFDSANIDVSSLATALEVAGGSWAALLASASTADLRTRPEPAVWSALEYGAHVGDVLALFAARIDRTVAEDEPDLGWWDHEAAVVAEGYNDHDPSDVARAVEAGVEALIVSTDGLADDEWQRAATRRERERFTVEGMARFALHEAQHHLVDARSSIARRAHDESMARDMARVIEQELALLRTDVRGDADRLRDLLHDDFVELGASGRVWDRESVIEQLVSDPGLGDPAPGSEPRHMSARLVGGPDAVLVTYDLGGAERASLRSSIWVRDAQTWRLLFHQGTPAASR